MWREYARRHRTAISVVGTILTIAALVYALAGKRQEFVDALRGVKAPVLAATVLLQIVALLSRSEAWHLTIEAAGGTVARRVLFRASSMQVLGSVINGNLGVAMRIGALRRSSPDVAPQVPTLIAPLGIPWWAPVIAIAVLALVSAGLRHLAVNTERELWKGLTVLRTSNHGSRVVCFVLVAVFAQIFRNWMLLHAVGVPASLLDAVAVLIALVALSQLPVGPAVGAAAA